MLAIYRFPTQVEQGVVTVFSSVPEKQFDRVLVYHTAKLEN